MPSLRRDHPVLRRPSDSREKTSSTRRDACIANRYSDKTCVPTPPTLGCQHRSRKEERGVVLSQLLAEFATRLGRPPEPRDKAGPNDADGDGGGAMERDIDDGLFELSRVVPV